MAIIYGLKKIKTVYYCQKTIIHRVQKPPEVGIEPRTFGFIEVKYKCPGFDPHVGSFFRTLWVIVIDNNKLFLFFKSIYYGWFIALSKKFTETIWVWFLKKVAELWFSSLSYKITDRKTAVVVREGSRRHLAWVYQ